VHAAAARQHEVSMHVRHAVLAVLISSPAVPQLEASSKIPESCDDEPPSIGPVFPPPEERPEQLLAASDVGTQSPRTLGWGDVEEHAAAATAESANTDAAP
jgi:hypothetical protein